jgi:hypothetical protein
MLIIIPTRCAAMMANETPRPRELNAINSVVMETKLKIVVTKKPRRI